MLSANVNAQFAGGTGTESDPYIIQTAEQLNEVRNYLDGNNFRLDNDIDLTSYLAANSAENGWLPIGSDPEGITDRLMVTDMSYPDFTLTVPKLRMSDYSVLLNQAEYLV